jgi:hypothetical protein
MLPLRTELAMTFTEAVPNLGMERGDGRAASRRDAVSGRNILIWLAKASVFSPAAAF